jgi:hypothetical protein
VVGNPTKGIVGSSFTVFVKLASRTDRRDHLLASCPELIPESVREVPPLGLELGAFFRTSPTDFPVAA